jgi:hypothetical protein
MSERKRYQGGYCAFVSSYDGKAILSVNLARDTRRGKREHLQIEIELRRSSVRCVVNALRTFLQKEKEQLDLASF